MSTPSNQPTLLTVKEVAEQLRINVITVYAWIKEGKLPAIRIGKEWRVRSVDLNSWLDVRRSNG